MAIHQISPVDFTANIAAIAANQAAIEVNRDLLRDLSREYFTNQSQRFMGNAVATGSASSFMLYNNGSGGEKILLEFISIETSAGEEFTVGGYTGKTGWAEYLVPRNCFLGGSASSIAQCMYHTTGVFPDVVMHPYLLAATSLIIPFNGIIIPNGKGFGGKGTGNLAKGMSFFYREIS